VVKWFTIKFRLLVIVLGACIASPLSAQTIDEYGTITRDQWLRKNDEIFSRFDTNSDAVLDRGELEKLFKALDRDGDDRIGRGEAIWPQFDKDKDGWIEDEEFLGTAPLSRQQFLQRRGRTFEKFDRDDDGRIDSNERPVPGFLIFKF
jgi:Ca2+-binding EF-hand superfamily protein